LEFEKGGRVKELKGDKSKKKEKTGSSKSSSSKSKSGSKSGKRSSGAGAPHRISVTEDERRTRERVCGACTDIKNPYCPYVWAILVITCCCCMTLLCFKIHILNCTGRKFDDKQPQDSGKNPLLQPLLDATGETKDSGGN